MREKNNNGVVFGAIVAFLVLIVIIIVSVAAKSAIKPKDLNGLIKGMHAKVTEATPQKGTISLSDSSLYDELPDIDKYPITVKGNGTVDIEIFSSGEKAGSGDDSWLVDCAEDFNRQRITTSDGKSVTISVRKMASGTGADYIASGKYLPDLYTPSNELFGNYSIAQGGDMELYKERLVGNTAGILIKKNMSYKDANSVIEAVSKGEINVGYTNPQTSAAGLNLLLTLLNNNGGVASSSASEALSKFNANIPYIALTTQQLKTSAGNGTLDGLVSEYQAYITDKSLTKEYDFLPFGERHDNPLYIVGKASKNAVELEAIDIIYDYLSNDKCQKLASDKGFNYMDDYKSEIEANGSEVIQALSTYKIKKDSGKDIIAVFVADCSGSMNGQAIAALKDSLSNGINYINANNYVGLVSYSDDVTIELPIAEFDMNQKSYFQGAVNNLLANGTTSTYEALTVAMQMIEEAKEDHPDAKAMIFLLSDGQANGYYRLEHVKGALRDSEIPVYTIAYTSSADFDQMKDISSVNEAASINADSEDVTYQIKTLFNSQL